jgi:hypothetical protein
MEHKVYLHVCHISGDHMITMGINGWSRGDFAIGVSLGYDSRNYVLFLLSALEVGRQRLAVWLRSWMGADYATTLMPERWFWKGHQPGIRIWSPPPVAALIVLKQLAQLQQTWPYDTQHIVIIPWLLCQEEWKYRFEKETDIWFVLHTGEVWPHYVHKPLIVGIVFLIYRFHPWQIWLESKKVVEIRHKLSEMSKTSPVWVKDYLWKLWILLPVV